MRRLSFLAAFVGLGLAAGRLAAEPVPHLDLVRGLRQQGMPDFAMEYLDKLKGMKLPEVEPLLPLEYARTRLDLAAEEPDERKRAALLTQAREEFDQFLKTHPNHPQAAAANLDLARLQSLQAKGMLMKARRAEGKEQENKEKAIARAFFEQAAQRFEQAAKQSDAKIKGLDDTKDKALKADLQQARLRALLDQGVNLYDMAQTYRQEGPELVARGDVVRKAIKVFESLLNEPEKTAPVWVAHAWIGQCYYENDDRPKAEAEFQAVLKERTPASLPAVRLVRAFKVRHAFEGEDTSAKGVNRYMMARSLAETWLRDFPSARNSPEGLAVRFTLARSLQREAESGVRRDKASGKAVGISGTAEQQLKTAERIYRDLAESDNEYADRATRSRMQSILTRSDGANKGETKPDQVRKFEEGYLQALVQQARLTEYTTQLTQGKVTASDPAKALKDEEEKRSKATVEFLTRALELAKEEKPAPPAREVHEARVLLAYCYPLIGQPRKAAELAETLAREGPKARSAPQMAALAVNEYVVMLNRLRQTDDGGGNDREKQAREMADKVKDLTAYMEKTWPDEGVTDGARHTLGYLLRYEKKFDEALKVYARIRPTYPALPGARLEQGAALFGLVRNTDETNPQKVSEYVADNVAKHQREWKETVAAMEAVPPPPPAAAAPDAQTYCQMRMQLGQLFLLEGKHYDRVEAIGKGLVELIPRFTALKDRGGMRDDLVYGARALELSGIQGRGFVLLKERKYDEVAKLLDPVLEKIKADLDKGAPAETPPNFERMRRAQRDVLSLSLRASVQDNKIDRARELLEVLQKAGSTAEGSATVFRQLASTIRAQIETLRKENKPEEEKKLVEGFTQFLDSIAKQEKIPDSMLLFLSQGYGGVDRHAKAAELLERILKNPAPKKDGDDPKAADRFRQQVQYLLAREYRLGKEFDKAKKLVAEMLGTAQKRGWGFSSVEVRKESFFLLEDQKKYAEAVKAWVAYANNFAQKLPPFPARDNKEASQRRMYFELFFESQRCSARAYFEFNPKKAADPAKAAQSRDDGFGRVAQRLVDLEAKNPDLTPELKERIRELVEEYPPLKEKYKAARAKATNASVGSAR